MPAPSPRPWPVLFRAAELAAIIAASSATEESVAPGGVLLLGVPGIGATTLARAALARLVAQGRIGYTHDGEEGALCAWLGEDGPAEGAPVLLIDHPRTLSGDLVTRVARRVRAGSLTLLLTAHHGAALPAPLLALVRADLLARHEVHGLDLETVLAVLSAALGDLPAQQTAYRLHHLTAGHPLYLRELTRALLENGDLARDRYSWVWTAPLLPDRRVSDAVRMDLEPLSAEERQLLDVLSLAGIIPPDLLAGVVPDAALGALIDRGFVRTDTEGAALTHPLHGEVLRGLVYPARRRELLARIPPGRGPETPAALYRRVDWMIQGGLQPDPALLLHAAHAADALQRPELAITLCDRIIGHSMRSEPDLAAALILRAAMRRERGDTHAARADVRRAESVLVGCAPGGERALLEAHLAVVTADLLPPAGAGPQRASAPILAALAALPAGGGPDYERARLRLGTELLLRMPPAGRGVEAITPLREWLSGPAGRDAGSVVLIPALALGLALDGRLTEALTLSTAALAAIDRGPTEHHWLRTELITARFWACLWLGDPVRARQIYSASEHAGHHFDGGLEQAGIAHISAAYGSWTNALGSYRGALSHLAVTDPLGSRAMTWAGYALALAMSGDLPGARAARDRSRAESATSRHSVASESAFKLLLVDRALGEPQFAARVRRFLAAHSDSRVAEVRGRYLLVLATAGAERERARAELAEAGAGMDGAFPAALLAHADALVRADHRAAGLAEAELNRLGLWVPAAARGPLLTARQYEIAGQAAAGYSSAEIAERFHLSVRTVDTHLGHVFTRLGISRRAELSAVLGSAGGRGPAAGGP
ncbi:helix-turn-helix domain-containing protein [Mycetocola spongiae]|uniref:helix-turn-helix domain-containing protein n=1 Tax=Mycetocola spongiae TaxID=2859226 RepID=UPI001CF19A57|nr:helix-turn-helix transcriptional regulator [Mycetocola spongiae]UCR88631.1 LuxR C-terminal-related transcriptional regulator [Mycetocola spongiae]